MHWVLYGYHNTISLGTDGYDFQSAKVTLASLTLITLTLTRTLALTLTLAGTASP